MCSTLPSSCSFPHGPEGLAERYAVAGPVHEQEVDVVRAELLQALAGLADDAVVGEVARPDLGGEEDLIPAPAPKPRCPAPTSASLPYIWAVSTCL